MDRTKPPPGWQDGLSFNGDLHLPECWAGLDEAWREYDEMAAPAVAAERARIVAYARRIADGDGSDDYADEFVAKLAAGIEAGEHAK